MGGGGVCRALKRTHPYLGLEKSPGGGAFRTKIIENDLFYLHPLSGIVEITEMCSSEF